MTDILQLPGWKVSKTSSQGEHLVIEAEYTAHPDSCRVFHGRRRHGKRPGPVRRVQHPIPP
jgi:hypothetical protein